MGAEGFVGRVLGEVGGGELVGGEGLLVGVAGVGREVVEVELELLLLVLGEELGLGGLVGEELAFEALELGLVALLHG